jgi:hypothetical protein
LPVYIYMYLKYDKFNIFAEMFFIRQKRSKRENKTLLDNWQDKEDFWVKMMWEVWEWWINKMKKCDAIHSYLSKLTLGKLSSRKCFCVQSTSMFFWFYLRIKSILSKYLIISNTFQQHFKFKSSTSLSKFINLYS